MCKQKCKLGGYAETFFFVFIFLLFCIVNSLADKNSTWSYTRYSDFSFREFEHYHPATRRISKDSIDYKLLHAAIFFETNRQRHENNVPLFEHLILLEQAAFDHSNDMVQKDFFSHKSPIPGKKTLSDRLALYGVDQGYRAENIAIVFALEYESGQPVYTPDQNDGYFSYEYRGAPLGYRTYLDLAKTVVQQWMNSPGHRRNILNQNYKYLGVGAAFYEKKDFYYMGAFKVTQNFSSEGMN